MKKNQKGLLDKKNSKNDFVFDDDDQIELTNINLKDQDHLYDELRDEPSYHVLDIQKPVHQRTVIFNPQNNNNSQQSKPNNLKQTIPKTQNQQPQPNRQMPPPPQGYQQQPNYVYQQPVYNQVYYYQQPSLGSQLNQAINSFVNAIPKVRFEFPSNKIPQIKVVCNYCALQQMVPGDSAIFKCWTCRNNNQCEPKYGKFYCFNCKNQVWFPYQTSDLIRCGFCGLVNKIDSTNPAQLKKKTQEKDILKQ